MRRREFPRLTGMKPAPIAASTSSSAATLPVSMKIADEELPSYGELVKLLDTIDAPKSVSDIGIDEAIIPMTFKASKDIRDKYVLPRLFWDLGILDEII